MIGAGSGSEVVGLARVGINVVALERDGRQFRAMTERITSEAAFAARAIAQQEVEEMETALLQVLASRFPKLNPDVGSHFQQSVEAAAGIDDANQEEKPSAVAPGSAAKMCPACGQAIGEKETTSCNRAGCSVGLLHADCSVKCKQCPGNFCSDQCAEDHGHH